jgi:hypothetical protein
MEHSAISPEKIFPNNYCSSEIREICNAQGLMVYLLLLTRGYAVTGLEFHEFLSCAI